MIRAEKIYSKVTMFVKIALLILLRLTTISLQHEVIPERCPVYAGKSFFVNTSGVNSVTCGTKSKPCYSISYAVDLAVQQKVSSLIVNISMGSYNEAESINLDCRRWNLRRVTFWGERDGEQVVEVDFSLDAQFCDVSLVDLHWKNSRPVFHHAFLSDVTICQCTVKGTNIGITGSSSNINLKYSNVSASSGYLPSLPLLSMASLAGFNQTMHIVNCNFVKNLGPILIVGNVYKASIVNSHLEANIASSDGTILKAQFSHFDILGTKFVRNFGTLLVLDDDFSSASLEECHFSCNMINKSLFLSPVMLHHVRQVSCDNCTVDQDCPVHCSPGEFLSDSILCRPCPAGSYSPGTVSNKTLLQCISCPAGTYSSKTRSDECTPCAEDTVSSKTGSTICTKCKNDFFTSKPGQPSCSSVTVGFIALTVFVSLLIFGPLLILVIQSSSRTNLKEKCSSCIPLTPVRQKLCEDETPNYSVQDNGYTRAKARATKA